MRAGIIGTGAIAAKHAEAYRNLGFAVAGCTNTDPHKGRAFAHRFNTRFVETAEELAALPDVEMLDVCTLPQARLAAVEIAAAARKHILVEKPLATTPAVARQMMECAADAGIRLGVVSQHRFDASILYLRQAIAEGRLGRILEGDAYVKWHRSEEYYSRLIKGSWQVEGGGALINQGIHSLDMLLFLLGPVTEVCGMWQLGGLHAIESEDILNALLRYQSGATGVIQAATALWPGDTERLEIHGSNGSVTITGDCFSRWEIRDDPGPPASLFASADTSGAADPMAISTLPLERQIADFAQACRTGTPMVNSAEEGYRAVELVSAIYASCRTQRRVLL